jgi:O-antigen ligase/tetratricopeptide (TPR) repeat protein
MRTLHQTLPLALVVLTLFVYAGAAHLRYAPPFAALFSSVALFVLVSWGYGKLARRERLARSPLALPLVALLGATALSTFCSTDLRLSTDELLRTLVLVLAFFLICDLLLDGWSPALFLSALLWLATLLLLAGLWSIATHVWEQTRAAGYPTGLLDYRLFGVTDHPNLLAALLNLALPFAIVRMARARPGWSRVGWAIWLLAYEVVLFFTRSRGGWVAAAVVVALTVGSLLRSHGWPHRVGGRVRVRRSWPLLATTLLYCGLFLLLLRGPDLWSQLTRTPAPVRSTYTTNAGETIASAFQNHRMVLWDLAWDQFREHPLTGGGPLTFGYAYVNELHSVRFWVSSHAHSLFFETLGTRGIVGSLSLAWLAWLVLVTAVPAPRSPVPSPIPALAGYLVHSLVDVPGKLVLNDLLVMLLLAISVARSGNLWRDDRTLPRWSISVLLVVPVLLFVFVRHALGTTALHQAIAAGMDRDWPAAAQAMDTAVAADPQFALYHGQRAYAYGVLAVPVAGEGSETALHQALEYHEQAVQTEPATVPLLLNMSLLLDLSGNDAQAVQMLTQAAALPQAQYWALPHLLLGDYYARQGKHMAAREAFRVAVASETHATAMAACQRSAACRGFTQNPDSHPAWEAHQQAQRLIAQGRPAQSLAVLDAIPLTSADPHPWLDRADAHLLLAQMDEARYALRIAETMRQNSQVAAATRTHAALVRARLLLRQGQRTRAAAVLRGAAHAGDPFSSYSYSLFRRPRLPGDLLPRLELLQRTRQDVEMYHLLAQLEVEQGRTDEADWALQMAETLAETLAGLGGE